tara:strand:+ start:21842 stop:22534 length:693 start_codon:yes stop_codon:yes gene_type:complete
MNDDDLKSIYINNYTSKSGEKLKLPNGAEAPIGLVRNYGSVFYDLFRESINDKKINQRFNLKDKVILDIGCGSGQFCYDAVSLFGAKNAYGIDIASVSLGITDSFVSDQVKFFDGDSTKIPLEDDSVDIVTSFLVLEHIPIDDLMNVLSEMDRVSKEGWILSIHHLGSSKNTPKRLTVRDFRWWKKEIKKYMSEVELIDIPSDKGKWGTGESIRYSRTVSVSKKFRRKND